MAGDLLGSYGSLARYKNCPRVLKVNENIILGAGGDYGDFQYVKDMIEQKMYSNISFFYYFLHLNLQN